MPELAEIWKQAVPTILNSVTGRGVWTAVNAARPVVVDEETFVLGLPPNDGELGGHLRMSNISRTIEQTISGVVGKPVRLRVIDGVTIDDWERVKRRDAERRRLQEAELNKMRAEIGAKSSWDSIYEQLSRRFAAISNRSLPQNRARFLEEAVSLIVELRKTQTETDDLAERNFARCLERVAQYTEIPSVIVAQHVLHRSGEL